MSKKEEKKASFELVRTIAPLPLAQRSYPYHFGYGNTDWIAYGNGRLVILRSLKDPSISDCAFTEHKGNVTVAKISPSGAWVCSGDDTGTVIVWGLKNKIVKQTLKINKKIYDIDWAPDSTKIIAVGDGSESKSKVFPYDSGNAVGVVEQHAKTILSVSYKSSKPHRIATGSEDQTTNLYEGPPFKFMKQMEQEVPVSCVRFSPDGNNYVIVGGSGMVRLFEGKEGKKIKDIKDEKNGHTGSVLSVTWSADGKKILTASQDKTVKLWDVEKGQVDFTWDIGGKGGSYQTQQSSVLWYGSYMISLSLSGAINYLSDKSDKPVQCIQGVQQPFTAWAYNKATGNLYTADTSGQLTTFDTSKGVGTWWDAKNSHKKIIVGMAVNATGSHLWTISHDNTVKYNDLKDHSYSSGASGLGSSPVAVAGANKDETLAAVILTEKLLIVREEKIVNTVEFKANAISLCWSLDDTNIAVGCTDGKVRLFEVDKDSANHTLTYENHVGRVVSVNYTPSGNLLSMGFDHFIYFWEKKDKVLNKTGWPHHNASVVSATFNSDGSMMATGSQDQNIIVWKDLKGLDDTKMTKIELAHLEGVLFVCFLKGDLLLSLGVDKTIKIWKV